LKFFNSSMDCYYDFKRKTKRKSLWIDLRNLWTHFKWLSIAVFCIQWLSIAVFCIQCLSHLKLKFMYIVQWSLN
jgi:hypothetical protein